MIFTETKLRGAYIIALEQQEDSRGFFARSFCAREFRSQGLAGTFVQCNCPVTRAGERFGACIFNASTWRNQAGALHGWDHP